VRDKNGSVKLYFRISINLSLITRYYKADQIKENEVGRTCGTHGRGGKVYRVEVGKPEGKTALGRPSSRWEDLIIMDLGEIGGGGGGVDSLDSG
jgi:hypothetical protein